MNKREHDSFKLQFLLTHQISRSYIADKLKVEKPLSEKLKQLASSFLGKDKLLNEWHHCIPLTLLCCSGCYRLGIFMADLKLLESWWATISFSHANRMFNRNLQIHEEHQIDAARAISWPDGLVKVRITGYQHLFDMRGFTSVCGYT